jgi:hypothetical protein
MRTVLSLVGEYLRPGDCFIDIGAKNGVASTLPASALVGPTGFVIAIEPDRERFQRLRHNVASAVKTNIRCLNLTPADKCDEAATSQGHYIRIDALYRTEALTSVSLIKISIPGNELSTLSGIGELIFGRDAPNIIFEMQRSADQPADTAIRLQDLLEAADYDVKLNGPFIIASSPARRARQFSSCYTSHQRSQNWCRAPSVSAQVSYV